MMYNRQGGREHGSAPQHCMECMATHEPSTYKHQSETAAAADESKYSSQQPVMTSVASAVQVTEQNPTSSKVMQALVQHNRRCLHAQHKQQQQQTDSGNKSCPLLVVGYVMKASREEQLSSAGLLHLLPQDNMCFMPVDITCLSDDQGHIDILLHKGSDELITTADGGVKWSDNFKQLQHWAEGQSHVCVVDPFSHTKKVSVVILLTTPSW